MEAGIEPASPQLYYVKLYTMVLDLSTMSNTLSQILYYTQKKSEQRIIENLLSTINSQLRMVLCALRTTVAKNLPTRGTEFLSYTSPTECHLRISAIHNSLWRQLSRPLNSSIARSYIFDCLVLIEQIISIATKGSVSSSDKHQFIKPVHSCLPSVGQQVITDPKEILNPYEVSLTSNYYFPLADMGTDEDFDEPSISEGATVKSPSKHTKTTVITEDSIDVISDILADMEEDELPVQTQPDTDDFQPASQVQPSYFNHRFAIYRKRSTPYLANAPSQGKLFISFCKCLKSIDPQLQILPMRNDRHIHPLSTTDQINNIDEIGVTNFFKAYKRTRKTLSGDFHIGTKLTFDEIKDHKNLTTWFHMHGYNVFLNSCQTSDMVRVGFLSRVRTFTYRDDLCTYIMNSNQWKDNPFHFRLYFDTFSTNAKGSLTYVLMVDVDRPNIDIGLTFLQKFFDGDLYHSPNKIAYLFFPLYRKNYSDDERLTIIKDNDHFTEGVSVVALSGLNDLNTVVHLKQGMTTTIRHLLLAIPAQTSVNKLFLQIERQPSNHWLLCCFYSTDATKVSLRLGALEALLKRYVKPEDYTALFSTVDFSLKFNGQAAPLKKGRTPRIMQEAPEETVTYARTAMKKLRTLNPKRLADDFNNSQTEPSVDQPIQTVTPTTRCTVEVTPPPDSNDASRFQSFEQNLVNQNNRLTRLEECCGQLANSTKNLQTELAGMNETMNSRMSEMAAAIGRLTTSPNYSNHKAQKSHDSPIMDLDL